MKFIINYYDKLSNRPMYKFYLNLFFLKMNNYFCIKHTAYIHIFLHIKKMLQVKLFKFNYAFYNNFVLYFLLLNIVGQIFLFYCF